MQGRSLNRFLPSWTRSLSDARPNFVLPQYASFDVPNGITLYFVPVSSNNSPTLNYHLQGPDGITKCFTIDTDASCTTIHDVRRNCRFVAVYHGRTPTVGVENSRDVEAVENFLCWNPNRVPGMPAHGYDLVFPHLEFLHLTGGQQLLADEV